MIKRFQRPTDKISTLYIAFVGLVLCIGGVLAMGRTPDTLKQSILASPLVGATRIDSRGEGQVIETLPTGQYTYFRLAQDKADVWYVVMSESVKPGTLIRYRAYARLDNYYSRTLQRTFQHVMFSTIKPQGS